MKKILLYFCLLLLYSTNIFAQGTTITLGLPAADGNAVDIPLTVTNFNNIGAISLKISYDTTALKFVGIANSSSNIVFIKNASGGAVLLGWFDATVTTPLNITNGKLVDLLFTGNGNTGSLNFVASACEISDETGKALSVTYINGK
jgi:hypothetical protein